ncbi:DUF6585 family protein [Kribbella ginsengisoli]|uniref:Uncharacterized protein n=1 Tax=Kribbella ginsengisoli TaxID=363865 RepID=A0ABP6YUQ0_9ACTN
MSDRISAAVAHARLGEHRATHLPREHSSGWVILSVTAVLCGVFGFGSLLADGPAFLSVVFTPLAIGAGWWAVRAAYKAAHKGRVRLDLFEHGMTFVDHRGQVSAFRWDSMQVRQSILKQTADFGAVSQTSFSYRVVGPDGAAATIEGSHEGNTAVDAWGPAIQEAVTVAQLPGAVVRFRQGDTLVFGDLTISWDLVGAKGKLTPWAQVETAYVANGQLYLRTKGSKRGKVLSQISQIPNYYVFYSLLELRLSSRK